jgi:hypothetical protein
MRIYGPVLLTILTFIASTPAGATDVDALRQFGLLGRQAIDCNAPYSASNPHVIFAATPDGGVTRTLRMTNDLNATLAIRNVHMAGPNLLEYEETGRQSELRTDLAKIDGKIRSWRSVRTSGPESGTVLIADGKLVSSGTPTLAFTICDAD